MMKKEQVSYLVDIVKQEIDKKSQIEFSPKIEELEKILVDFSEDQYETVDDFAVECLVIFESRKIGFPNEIYKGLSKEDILSSINAIARRFKEELCKYLNTHPDVNFKETSKDIWVQSINATVTSLLKSAGIPNVFVVILLSAYIVYLAKTGMKEICK